MVLTQVVLAATGLFTLVVFPTICRHFVSTPTRRLSHLALIVLRTTPEYMLAYPFVQLWGRRCCRQCAPSFSTTEPSWVT